MKTILFAALLSVSGIALAQDTTDETMTDETMTDETMTDETMTEQPTTDETVSPPADPVPPPTTPPADPTAPTTPPVDPTMPPATPPSADPTMPPATAGTPTTVAPSNENPERDARGIPVVSDSATAPAGANQPVSAPAGATVVPSSNQSAVFATEPGQQDYPPCSKEVTDNCVQNYERGVGPD